MPRGQKRYCEMTINQLRAFHKKRRRRQRKKATVTLRTAARTLRVPTWSVPRLISGESINGKRRYDKARVRALKDARKRQDHIERSRSRRTGDGSSPSEPEVTVFWGPSSTDDRLGRSDQSSERTVQSAAARRKRR